jgi:hypothetical protein
LIEAVEAVADTLWRYVDVAPFWALICLAKE